MGVFVATMPSLESDSANVQPVVYQKFGEMELPEDEEDGDYSPSESDSDDSLEWANEETNTGETETEETDTWEIFTDPLAIYVASFPVVHILLKATDLSLETTDGMLHWSARKVDFIQTCVQRLRSAAEHLRKEGVGLNGTEEAKKTGRSYSDWGSYGDPRCGISLRQEMRKLTSFE